MKYRKHIRLKDYNYSENGYYFVTICTKNRNPLFTDASSYATNRNVAAPSHGATSLKNIVDKKLKQVKKYYHGVKIDYSIIMPDHIHIIFVLEDSEVSLPKVINVFKLKKNQPHKVGRLQKN
jgi:putative transposase